MQPVCSKLDLHIHGGKNFHAHRKLHPTSADLKKNGGYPSNNNIKCEDVQIIFIVGRKPLIQVKVS
jgi:hypothetical protein